MFFRGQGGFFSGPLFFSSGPLPSDGINFFGCLIFFFYILYF